MGLVTMETATDIWIAYNEIAKAEKLLEEIKAESDKGYEPTPRDAFGRHRRLSLGVPTAQNSERLLDVAPALAKAVIKAHIAEKRAVLEAACERARQELGAAVTPA